MCPRMYIRKSESQQISDGPATQKVPSRHCNILASHGQKSPNVVGHKSTAVTRRTLQKSHSNGSDGRLKREVVGTRWLFRRNVAVGPVVAVVAVLPLCGSTDLICNE